MLKIIFFILIWFIYYFYHNFLFLLNNIEVKNIMIVYSVIFVQSQNGNLV